jgi:hypothetical protein
MGKFAAANSNPKPDGHQQSSETRFPRAAFL